MGLRRVQGESGKVSKRILRFRSKAEMLLKKT